MVGGVGGDMLLDMHLGGVLDGVVDHGDGVDRGQDGGGVVHHRGGNLNLGQLNLDLLDSNAGGAGDSHTVEAGVAKMAGAIDSGTIDSGAIDSGAIDSGGIGVDEEGGVSSGGAQGGSDNSGENGKGLHVGW